MKAPTMSKRIWLVISTVAVIGGFFGYYFFVYMETRKIDLEAKKFRTLEQYAENIKNAYDERTKRLFKSRTSECVDTLDCIPVTKFDDLRKSTILRRSTIKGIDFARLKRLGVGSETCVPITKARKVLSSIRSREELVRVEKFLFVGFNCVSSDSLKEARDIVMEPVVKQSDFSDLVFEVNSVIERQTFQNSIDTSIVNTILRKENAA